MGIHFRSPGARRFFQPLFGLARLRSVHDAQRLSVIRHRDQPSLRAKTELLRLQGP